MLRPEAYHLLIQLLSFAWVRQGSLLSVPADWAIKGGKLNLGDGCIPVSSPYLILLNLLSSLTLLRKPVSAKLAEHLWVHTATLHDTSSILCHRAKLLLTFQITHKWTRSSPSRMRPRQRFAILDTPALSIAIQNGAKCIPAFLTRVIGCRSRTHGWVAKAKLTVTTRCPSCSTQRGMSLCA